ncbi:serine/threonine protein kinase [Planomonospora sp. ID67723]|uniref:serine/threonine-protein kinase n=1 Tax=Planomonospora sp. ID67723 TaxID=2738134 RepID=UPI0018C381D0|nr:serine/threonine-protein kinase [Planomonospora sp. ID67723]MBG0830883.1 serine/threonine protein kinase [Planomonospora sp. ID67723]
MAYGLPPVLALESADPVELGPYRVAGRLGRGGMGTVYLGEGPSGPVAIKVINRHLAADPEFVARFRSEVAAARRVSRFCTAPVLDARLEGEPLWVVTEYVAGPDLARLLREQGPLTGSNLEALAVGVAAALTAIHGAGVVHRDLKPANVLLSPLGPRVIDFGIARALDAGRGQTVTGKILGTPEYMAPELVSESRSGPPADVFAWGCVVAAAATGASPFASRTVPEALYRVVHDTPNLDGLDPDLRGLVEAALDKDPLARPSAMDLLSGLVGQKEAADTVRVAGTVRLDLSGLVAPTARVAAGEEPAGRSRLPRRPYLVGGAVGGALLLAAAGVLGVRALSEGPPEITDVLYQDDFGNDTSGWYSDGTRVDTRQGYTGDGRYTISTDSTEYSRLGAAPVNAESPEHALVSAKIDIAAGTPHSAWGGVFCEYRLDDKHFSYYIAEARPDGRARIRKVTETTSLDLTADTVVPDFKKNGAVLRAECERGGDQVRVALWAGDAPVAEVVDEEAAGAKGKPKFGLSASKWTGADQDTRVYFDDFRIGRLP